MNFFSFPLLKTMSRWFCLILLVVIGHSSFSKCLSADELYLNEIKPLLKTKCWACHGPLKQESGLRLDAGSLIHQGGDSGPAVIAEQSEKSLLLQRISAHDEFERMPPEGEPLTKKQVALFKQWIEAGAHSPSNEEPQLSPEEHWAFQALKKFTSAELGQIQHPNSVNPIDNFIQRKLNEQGLKQSPQAEPRDLLRRLYLNMHGLPPSFEEVQKFETDPTADHFKKEIENVLASPRYGERWAQHWLDIVRYADTHGYEVNTPRPNAWHYRDYVIESLNSDKPYDQFVREQLAGDSYQQDAATGFLVAAAVLLPGQIGKDEPSKRLARQDALDEMIVGTSATFLGLTLGCARCHDHKFDPMTAKDYYSMQAFFAGVSYGDREIRDEDYERRQSEIARLKPQIDDLHDKLKTIEADAFVGRTIIIDDEDLEHVTVLQEENGHGENSTGRKRGYQDDPGGNHRLPNISEGRYTWWDNKPGDDVFTYNLEVEGDFQIWISWGVHGSGVHTRDARYVLDLDGDLSTQDDQAEVAQVDQYYVAGRSSGETEKRPLWSSFRSVGSHVINKNSKLIVRGGETGTGITADVIILQEKTDSSNPDRELPQLREPVNFEQNVEHISPIKIKKIRFTSLATTNNDRYEPCLDELEVFGPGDSEKNLALAKPGVVPSASGNYSTTGKHQLKHINDGEYGNPKSWISNEKGRGWVQLNFPEPVTVDRIVWGRDRLGRFKDRLPVKYRIEVSEEGENWTLVASSSDRLPFNTVYDESSLRVRNASPQHKNQITMISRDLEKLERQREKLSKPEMVYAGVFRTPNETNLLLRGDPEQPQEPVLPAVPKVLGNVELPESAEDATRRKTLAEWITRPDHPLTARVIVNRVWQYHFGTGLVETPSDFGLNGTTPSHPELLDWLATELIEHNWSLKHLHRLILNSKTWQQSNQIDQVAQKIDADCRLLWRFPSRRLEAELIRDSLLQVSGKLNLKMGGPGFNFFKSRGGLSGFPPVTEFDENGLRRMIYAHKIRMESVPVFGAFDCPDAGQPTPVRSQSTTAIQALNLFNSPFVADLAISISDELEKYHPGTNDQAVKAFRMLLLRDPTQAELKAVSEVIQEQGLATVIRVLMNSNEFLMLP